MIQGAAVPLDFSFSELTDIAQLRKAPVRGAGKRKKYIDVDEEEEMKKVSPSQ